MLSVEELDSIIINSDPEKESLKDIVSGLEPFDAKNLIALVRLIAKSGETSFEAGYHQGVSDFREFIYEKYDIKEKSNGIST